MKENHRTCGSVPHETHHPQPEQPLRTFSRQGRVGTRRDQLRFRDGGMAFPPQPSPRSEVAIVLLKAGSKDRRRVSGSAGAQALCLTRWKPFLTRIFDRKQEISVPALTSHSGEKTDAASQPSAGVTPEAASPLPVAPLQVTDKKRLLFYSPSVIYHYPGAQKHALGLNILNKTRECAGPVGRSGRGEKSAKCPLTGGGWAEGA